MLSLGTVYYIGLVLYNRKEIRDTNTKYIEPGKKYDIINIKEYIIDTFGVFGNNIDNRYLDPNSIVPCSANLKTPRGLKILTLTLAKSS